MTGRNVSSDQLNIIVADTDFSFTGRIKKLCRTLPGLNVVGTAHSRRMLLAKINQGNVDLVLMKQSCELGDIRMVDELKDRDPDLDILILYDADDPDSLTLINALELGVNECMELAGPEDDRKFKEFRLRLLTLTGLLLSRRRFSGRKQSAYRSKFFAKARTRAPAAPFLKPQGKIEIVVIASSTGGPEILSRIFSILPGNLKVPVLLVQHIPEKITAYFARSLNEKSELEIRLAKHGEEILPARVYLAPGGHHMKVSMPDGQGKRTLILDNSAPVNSVRPSADLLFESIAESFHGNALAVVLTGMGEDGKKGVAALKQKGCYCITQSEDTCVVYGMPRAIDDAGLSDERLDPLSITQRIVNLVQ